MYSDAFRRTYILLPIVEEQGFLRIDTTILKHFLEDCDSRLIILHVATIESAVEIIVQRVSITAEVVRLRPFHDKRIGVAE